MSYPLEPWNGFDPAYCPCKPNGCPYDVVQDACHSSCDCEGEVIKGLGMDNDATPIESLFGPGYTTPIRPTQDAYFLDIAGMVSKRGTCGRLRVGAVLVSESQIIATGYNGAPAGMPHCQHDDDSPCTVAIHAESNVLIQSARHGRASDKASLYLTHAPCFTCAGLIINAGIRVVRYATPYRNNDGINRLGNGRVYHEGGY